MISSFKEKPKGDGAWINGGFFICNKEIFSSILNGDETIFERGPLEKMAQANQLMAFKHSSFWQCMDTLRDKNLLSELWDGGDAPWKTWK